MTLSRRGFLAGSLAAVALPPALRPSDAWAVPLAQVPGPDDLPWLTIAEAAPLLRSRRLSPVALIDAVLARIDRVEPRVHAFLTVTRDQARRAAETAEQEIAAGRYRGPLHGIPFAVKDTHYTRGVRTTANTPVLSRFVPDVDAAVVERLQRAGAILVGKLSLPEFSFGGSPSGGGEFPDTRNPWDLTRTPGGSSSGSGAALAAGLTIAATGGDTSGSIRNPAATCGVVGMKPTYGRVSRHGIIAISWTLDHIGPMSRSVADNALLLNTLAGHDPRDRSSSPMPVPDYTAALTRGVRGMRIGIPKPAMFDGYHPDVMRAYRDALDVFRTQGARTVEVDMPPTLDAADDVQTIVRITEAAAYHRPWLASQADRYGRTNVRRDVEAGSLITAPQYLRAQQVRARFVEEFRTLFETFDVFMTPGMPAPAGEPANVRQPFRRIFNVCGFPALVLPSGLSTHPPGLPLSLQIAAKPFAEETIYAAAAVFENAISPLPYPDASSRRAGA